MAWKGREKPDVQFSLLLNALNNSRISQTNNALYQTIYEIITRIQNFRDRTITKLVDLSDLIIQVGDTILDLNNKLKDASFYSRNDETLNFPSSYQVIAAPGITLDYTVPNKVTVSASGAGALYMIIADPPAIISDGTRTVIILPFTLPIEIP